MNLNVTKWNPWNWFKDEELGRGRNLPVQRRLKGGGDNIPNIPATYAEDPLWNVHREIDRLFDDMFTGFASPMSSLWAERSPMAGLDRDLIRPNVDIKETKNEYKITVEVPGVEKDDINLELSDHALAISGEKKHEKEDQDERYHSIERSYGSFRRVISLPEDVKEEEIDASFKKGLLTISIPRREEAIHREGTKQIEIKKG